MVNLFTVTPHTAIDHIITLDQLNTGNLVANAAHQFPAGKGVNVAKTIASMKARVTALGFIGQQSTERFRPLDSTLLTTDFSQVPGFVRQNITLQTRSIDQETHIRTPGFAVTEKDTHALINKINATIQPDDIVILSGSLPPGCNSHFYADVITHCHKKNTRILLDSSGQSLANSIKATPYLIKPNLIEMEALVGYPLTHTTAIINAAQHFIHQGIQVVIVSLGKDGIIAVTQAGAVQLRCDRLPNQELINTIGCGDALMGGLALAYQQNKSFPEALKLAISCATANLFSQEPGNISPRLVNEIKSMVRLNSIKNP